MTIPTVEISLTGGPEGQPTGNGIPALPVPRQAPMSAQRPSEPAAARVPAPDQVTAEASSMAAPDAEDVATVPASAAVPDGSEPASVGAAVTGAPDDASGAPSATGSVAGAGTGSGTGTGVGLGSGAPLPAAAGLIPPEPRSDIRPLYPRSARRAGWEGVVRISALVDALGMVLSAEVASSSGHAVLDQAALEAVRETFFTPALQAGTTIACRVIIPVRFQLK